MAAMALSIGIVGLPNVGKSSLFRALTRNNVVIANYPFATIEPNTGVVAVPDDRLEQLAATFKPQKVVPATVQFTDIAGLIAGAHQGEGLGNKFLAHIRETEAICLVVRAFSDPDVTHVSGQSNPQTDIETIKTELMLADLETLNSALPKWQKQAKAEPTLAAEIKQLETASLQLRQGKWPQERPTFDQPDLNGLLNQLLSYKPLIYVFNLDEAELKNQTYRQQLQQLVSPTSALFIAAKLEAELAELNQEEAAELLQSAGLSESGLMAVIKAGYQILGLATFFTAGEPEVRAWTIKAESLAPVAAGAIHTDFQRGFIAAEVIEWQQLVDCGNWVEARAKGRVRSEGKDYHVQDGDVINFKFNR